MSRTFLYQKIQTIARRLKKKGITYTRADLAYDLEEFGITCDTSRIGTWVLEAYNYFNHDEDIRDAFRDNENGRPLVEEAMVEDLSGKRDDDALFALLQQKLEEGRKSLSLVRSNVRENPDKPADGKEISALNTIVGNQGAVNIKKEASGIFGRYSSLIGYYDNAKQQVQYLISDFTTLRGRVCDVYRKYSSMLTDAFGDSVRAVSPELFDFDSIEWLDVQGMLKNVQLDYDRLTEKCSVLMSDIADDFAQSLKNASLSYRQAGSKQAGLLIAGLNMISHYADAAARTSTLKQELLTLKNSVSHDSALIKGDLGRLLVIFKNLNDVYIPKTEAFCRFCDQVLTDEWKELEDALYGDSSIRDMKLQRDSIIAELHGIEKEMTDEEIHISYYKSRVEASERTMKDMHKQYREAKSSKPEKPSGLKNMFSFGAAGSNYNRSVYEWNETCGPVIRQYEELAIDIKLDKDELSAHREELKKNRKRYMELRTGLSRQNRLIMEHIKVRPEIRLRMLSHLEEMIKLLRAARDIAESRLDGKLTKAVTLSRQEIDIPPEIQGNISTFAQTMRENIYLEAPALRQPQENAQAQESVQTRENAALTQEDLNGITDAWNNAIGSIVGLLESWGNMKAMQMQGEYAEQAYNEELARMQEDFRKAIDGIDKDSEALRETLRKLNTAQDHEQLKEGLMELSGKEGRKFTDEEWDRFLNGKMTIEL